MKYIFSILSLCLLATSASAVHDPTNPVHVLNLNLMEAARLGQHARVALMHAEGADINFQEENGQTPLMNAVRHGHIRIAQYLLSQPSIEIWRADLHGNTALHLLARQRGFNLDTERLIRTFLRLPSNPLYNFSTWDAAGLTPFTVAMSTGNYGMVQLLAERDEVLPARNANGLTQIAQALAFHDPRITEIVLRASGNLHIMNANGTSLLTWAIGQDMSSSVVSDILDAQVDGRLDFSDDAAGGARIGGIADRPDANGNYPLHVAAEMGRDDIVQLLHERGARVDRTNAAGLTPIDLAVNTDQDGLAVRLATPSHSPLSLGLLTRGDLIFSAIELRSPILLRAAIRRGDDINSITEARVFHPLALELRRGEDADPEMVRALLEGGANTLLATDNDLNVVALATRTRNQAIISLLRNHIDNRRSAEYAGILPFPSSASTVTAVILALSMGAARAAGGSSGDDSL